MWPLPVLLLLVVQGHFSICQEREVRGTEGGNLTAYCEYTKGWESYKKWWCRGRNWDSCRILVKTPGSEQLVKKGRVSIQDDHSIRTITMTLEELRLDDADTYWCGIEKTGKDLGYKFSVIVDPAPVLAGSPKPVPGPTPASWDSSLARPTPTTRDSSLARPTPASWDSSFPLTQGITSNQPVTLINPNGRSRTLTATVAAEKGKDLSSFHPQSSGVPVISPVWILLVPLFLVTLEWLCRG